MEGVVADLVAVAHGEHGVARRGQSAAVQFAMGEARRIRLGIRPRVRQVRGELLPDGVGYRRLIVREARQTRLERPLACRADFASDRIAVAQIEQA